jgi:hypothetical protein
MGNVTIMETDGVLSIDRSKSIGNFVELRDLGHILT